MAEFVRASHKTVTDTFRQRLAQWRETDIAWDGFNLGTYNPIVGRPFIRPTLFRYQSTRRTFYSTGNPLVTEEGALIVDVFVPSGSGTSYADTLCDMICDMLRDFADANSRGLWLYEPSVEVIGSSFDDRDWYMLKVETPWIFMMRPFVYPKLHYTDLNYSQFYYFLYDTDGLQILDTEGNPILA